MYELCAVRYFPRYDQCLGALYQSGTLNVKRQVDFDREPNFSICKNVYHLLGAV